MITEDRKKMHTVQLDKTEEFTAEETRALLDVSAERTKADIDAYVKRAEALEDEPDTKILEMVRAVDKGCITHGEDTKKKAPHGSRSFGRLSRYVAVFLISCISVVTVGAVTSDAFRAKLFNIFVSEETGSVVLESIPEDSPMEGWSDYWYPEYLPEGFKFTAAEDSGLEKIIRFDSIDSDGCIIITIWNSEGHTASYNTEGKEYGNISIGEYDGYYFDDKEDSTCIVTWLTEEQTIMMSAQNVDKGEIIKVAESMVYMK